MEVVTTLLLISRHQLSTNGLRALFQAERAYRVVGEVCDGPGAVEAAQRLNPRVIVVDLIAQVLNGLAFVRELKQRVPEACIVTVAMCTDPSYVSHALRSGASAYVLKAEGFHALLNAIDEVCAGRQFLSAALDAEAIRKRLACHAPAELYDTLTSRELQVLQLAAEGRTSAQIAQLLGISRRTAETHRANIYKKLLLDNRTELVAFALRRGLLTRDM